MTESVEDILDNFHGIELIASRSLKYYALRDNWDTTAFDIDFKQLPITLGLTEPLKFHRFFVDRLSYYVLLQLLEGRTLIPRPKQIQSFDDLAKQLPNLAGILHHHTFAQRYPQAPLFSEYQALNAVAYTESYRARNINAAIKSGFSATEEVAFTPDAKLRFYELSLVKTEQGFFKVQREGALDLSISSELSQENGFTCRTPRLRHA